MQASMSDQLRAVLNQWEEGERSAQPAAPASAPAPEEPPRAPFQITNNLNRAAFNEVKSSPGTRKQITARLLAKGYKIGSVSSVLGHMIKQGVVQVDDEWVLHVTVPEYVPLKSHKTLMRMKKNAAPQKKKPTVVISKKKEEVKRPVSSSVGAGLTALVPVPTPVPTPFNAEQAAHKVLESLTVLQAKALFNELKKIFGDAK